MDPSAPQQEAPNPLSAETEPMPTSGAPVADLSELENEISGLRHRLETAESQIQRHERMLRWTQLMLKHHERLLRRRAHKAVSNG